MDNGAFAESLQQEYAQIVVIELYCCAPGLLFYSTTTSKQGTSWVFDLCASIRKKYLSYITSEIIPDYVIDPCML